MLTRRVLMASALIPLPYWVYSWHTPHGQYRRVLRSQTRRPKFLLPEPYVEHAITTEMALRLEAPKKGLYVLAGVRGAGKSTYCQKALAAVTQGHVLYVSGLKHATREGLYEALGITGSKYSLAAIFRDKPRLTLIIDHADAALRDVRCLGLETELVAELAKLDIAVVFVSNDLFVANYLMATHKAKAWVATPLDFSKKQVAELANKRPTHNDCVAGTPAYALLLRDWAETPAYAAPLAQNTYYARSAFATLYRCV